MRSSAHSRAKAPSSIRQPQAPSTEIAKTPHDQLRQTLRHTHRALVPGLGTPEPLQTRSSALPAPATPGPPPALPSPLAGASERASAPVTNAAAAAAAAAL
eukprot:2778758-Rhodomonas_salina.5